MKIGYTTCRQGFNSRYGVHNFRIYERKSSKTLKPCSFFLFRVGGGGGGGPIVASSGSAMVEWGKKEGNIL